jgi:ketosteroid isomerase-like protein
MRVIFVVLASVLASPVFGQPTMTEVEMATARAKIASAAAKARADARSADEKAIVEADIAFAVDCATRGASAAFGDRMHPEGKLFPAGSPIVVGQEAVRLAFKDDKARWEWAPVQAVVTGDLGVTWGIALISEPGADGTTLAVTTRYTTVWRRDARGAWKIWIDVGTRGPLP